MTECRDVYGSEWGVRARVVIAPEISRASALITVR